MNSPLKISYKKIKIHKLSTSNAEKNIKKDRIFAGKMVIPTKTGYRILPLKQIEALIADGNYTRIQLQNNEKVLLSKTLKSISSQLDDRFYRIHNSTCINLDFLAEVSQSENTVILDSGSQYGISRQRKKAFIRLLSQHIGTQ